jgi:hypothetical protein
VPEWLVAVLTVGEREVLVLWLAQEARDFAEGVEGAELFLPGDVFRLLRRKIVLEQEDPLIGDFDLDKASVLLESVRHNRGPG